MVQCLLTREGHHNSHASQILRLTMLALEIVEAILAAARHGDSPARFRGLPGGADPGVAFAIVRVVTRGRADPIDF